MNLKTYLSEWMVLSDSVNIKDAFVVNIGVNYEIIVRPNYTGRNVLLDCNLVLQDYFDIWVDQFNALTISTIDSPSTSYQRNFTALVMIQI